MTVSAKPACCVSWVMGWFIGDYVYGRRHNSELDHKRSAAEQLLDHVRLGVALE